MEDREEKAYDRRRRIEEAREMIAHGLGRSKKALEKYFKEEVRHTDAMKDLGEELGTGWDMITRGHDILHELDK